MTQMNQSADARNSEIMVTLNREQIEVLEETLRLDLHAAFIPSNKRKTLEGIRTQLSAMLLGMKKDGISPI